MSPRLPPLATYRVLTMPLHESSLPAERRDPASEQANARLGLILFAVYLAGYVAFVSACAVAVKSFDAVAAGMALIGGAMLIAFLYTALCRTLQPGSDA